MGGLKFVVHIVVPSMSAVQFLPAYSFFVRCVLATECTLDYSKQACYGTPQTRVWHTSFGGRGC